MLQIRGVIRRDLDAYQFECEQPSSEGQLLASQLCQQLVSGLGLGSCLSLERNWALGGVLTGADSPSAELASTHGDDGECSRIRQEGITCRFNPTGCPVVPDKVQRSE